MVQKDAKAMKELATESKKDSSAMKTIALLGIVFLPGTFIAVSFLEPLFLNVFGSLNSDFENGHKGILTFYLGNFLDANFQLGW
jgi:hypothetical protein